MIFQVLSLEKTIFRLSCILAVLYEFYAIFIDLMFGLPPNHLLVDGILFLVFSSMVVLSYRLKDPLKSLQFPFIFLLFFGVGYFWVESGGFTGGSMGYIAMVVLMTLILVPNVPVNYWAAGVFFCMQVVLSVLEVTQPEIFKNPENLNLSSFPPTYLILNLFAGGVIALLRHLMYEEKRRLTNSKRLLSEKNDMINAKNEELNEKSEQIKRINQSLEKRVNERTKEILFQKRQIEEFTYLNAHKLRGAITRIVGLSTLQKDESSDEENKKLRDLIDQSAREADDVLKEITSKLNEETRKNLNQ